MPTRGHLRSPPRSAAGAPRRTTARGRGPSACALSATLFQTPSAARATRRTAAPGYAGALRAYLFPAVSHQPRSAGNRRYWHAVPVFVSIDSGALRHQRVRDLRIAPSAVRAAFLRLPCRARCRATNAAVYAAPQDPKTGSKSPFGENEKRGSKVPFSYSFC